MALALLQLIAFASTAAAITFTVQPGVAGRECLVQSLSPEHLLPGAWGCSESERSGGGHALTRCWARHHSA
jgi:hypothetical protein